MKTAMPRWTGMPKSRRIGPALASEPAQEKPSLRQVIKSGNRSLNAWGLFSILLYLTSVTVPLNGKVDMTFRAITLINGALFTFACLQFLRTSIRVVVPVVLVLVLQGWSLVSYIVGFGSTSRADEFGRQMYFLLEVVSPYFVVMCLAKLNPNWPRLVINLVVGLVTISGLVGIYEFLRLPGSSFFIMAFWEGMTFYDKNTEVVRSIGLTRHPILFGFQMNVGLALVTGLLYKSGPKIHLLLIASVMALGLFVSQSRTGYVSGMVFIPIILYIVGRHSRVAAASTIVVCAVSIFLLVTVFRSRLGYALGQENTFQTLEDRQRAWRISLETLRPYMVTGLGADATMLVSGGRGSRLNYSLAENAYLMYYGMYGLPGMAIFATTLLTALFGSCSVALRRELPVEVKSLALSVMMLVVLLAINGYSANLSHHNLYLQTTFLIAGALAATVVAQPNATGMGRRPSLNARLSGMADRYASK